MKIKLMFLAVALMGVMSSFTTKSQATGSLKVKIELPAGVSADLDQTPLGLFKTMEDAENEKVYKSGWTNASGNGTIVGAEEGKYFLDALAETEDGQVYYAVMPVEIKAGAAGSVVLKLVRNEEMEGDYSDEEE